MTNDQLDAILLMLDAAARRDPYPPMGLPLWGENNRREEFRVILALALAKQSAESTQR